MAKEWVENRTDFLDLTLDSYVALVADFVKRLRNDINIERYASSAPREMLLAPRFGVKPYVVEDRIKALLDHR
jgi:radical SAM superfamily enzyme